MSDSVKINKTYKIIKGCLMGWNGTVTGYDFESDIASVRLDEITTVDIKSEYIIEY
jgi:hypothetical protein